MALRLIIIFLFLSIPITGNSQSKSDIPTAKPNCNMDVPPVNAGDSKTQGYPLKIFPRKTQMGPKYTGCQTVWVLVLGEYHKMMVNYFEDGALKMIKAIEPADASQIMICEYQGRKLITTNPECPDVEVSISAGQGPPQPSMPPGCNEKMQKAQKEVPGCKFD